MRLLTALVVLGACGFAIIRGWDVVGFAKAQVQHHSDVAQPTPVRSWIDTPGLTGAALKASLAQMAPGTSVDDARKRADILAMLLAVRPLSPSDWLSLAGARLVTGESQQEVLSALTMSYVAGPNEGAVMLERAIFGLLQWETLPKVVLTRTIHDLAGAILGTAIGDNGMNVVKAVLNAKSSETRSQIARMLRAEEVSAVVLARMGL